MFNFIKAFFIGLFTSAESTLSIPAITNFDENKFLDTWYEYVRYDHWFERGLTNVFTEYVKTPSGDIQVLNNGTKNNKPKVIVGKAKLKYPDKPNVGELKVSFFGPFYNDYRIIWADEQFETIIVTGKTKDYFWILSKNPALSSLDFVKVINAAMSFGFEVNKMIINEKFN
jgi:apolipoprotein D and lipocalin family protein